MPRHSSKKDEKKTSKRGGACSMKKKKFVGGVRKRSEVGDIVTMECYDAGMSALTTLEVDLVHIRPETAGSAAAVCDEAVDLFGNLAKKLGRRRNDNSKAAVEAARVCADTVRPLAITLNDFIKCCEQQDNKNKKFFVAALRKYPEIIRVCKEDMQAAMGKVVLAAEDKATRAAAKVSAKIAKADDELLRTAAARRAEAAPAAAAAAAKAGSDSDIRKQLAATRTAQVKMRVEMNELVEKCRKLQKMQANSVMIPPCPVCRKKASKCKCEYDDDDDDDDCSDCSDCSDSDCSGSSSDCSSSEDDSGSSGSSEDDSEDDSGSSDGEDDDKY